MSDHVQGQLRALREELRNYVDGRLATMVKILPYSRSTASGTGDKLQGYPTAGSDEQKYDFEGRRVEPFGLRSVPPAGVMGAWVGVDASGLILGAESSRFGPSGLNDGEVALYNKISGVSILLDKNGAITITDKGGAQIKLDGSGNVTVQAAAPNGSVTVTATPATGTVALGPVGNLQVLVQGAQDPVFGAPILQAPAAVASIVKAG